MIELLVRNFYGPGGRALGDIVSVKEVPHNGWGLEEGPPTYSIIKVDCSLDDFKDYHQRHAFVLPQQAKAVKLVGPRVRSRYKINLAALKAANNGNIPAVAQKAMILNHLIDRRTE